jgi:hypothetical protein
MEVLGGLQILASAWALLGRKDRGHISPTKVTRTVPWRLRWQKSVAHLPADVSAHRTPSNLGHGEKLLATPESAALRHGVCFWSVG